MNTEQLGRLDEAIADIEINPEWWDQEVWFRRTRGCGTVACLAGNVAMRSGWWPAGWVKSEYDTNVETTCAVAKTNGELRQVAVVAQDLLGLTDEQAASLFHLNNTLRDLKRIRDELAADVT